MGTPGLGQAMNFAQSYGLNDQLYALALATGFLGLAIHLAMVGARAARAPLASLAAVGAGMSRGAPRRLAIAAEIAVPIAILLAWQAVERERGRASTSRASRRSSSSSRTCGSSRSSARTSCRA